MKRTTTKAREYLIVYRQYRGAHSAAYARFIARAIVFDGLPF